MTDLIHHMCAAIQIDENGDSIDDRTVLRKCHSTLQACMFDDDRFRLLALWVTSQAHKFDRNVTDELISQVREDLYSHTRLD
jgi:hypothetical protein